ncbi:phosphoribosyltransferase [Vulcanisaeta sp. JCM 16159]|uniref:phosphoribosyltransferase n=1 Tax=Vulcanisaeta sp. JCM 16159 TaxID=1295371 RepID=UPI000B2C5AD3|nr:phosphoribosyltransferase family protein [Vulcanisaeta sp. JCM 16159]
MLVVDDVTDTGKTLAVARDILRFYGAREVRTATLYVKPWSKIKPDYYVGTTDKWILFPWEVGEVIRSQVQGSSPESVIRSLRLSEYFGEDFVNKLTKLLR